MIIISAGSIFGSVCNLIGQELGNLLKNKLKKEQEFQKKNLRKKDPFLDLIYTDHLLSLQEYDNLTSKIESILDLEILIDHLKDNLKENKKDSEKYRRYINDLEHLKSFLKGQYNQ